MNRLAVWRWKWRHRRFVASPPYQALLVRVLPEDYEPPPLCFVDWAEHPEWGFADDIATSETA
jgi:hypothetical protein